MTVELRRPSKIHIIGVGGAGMGAIASVLAGMGHQVSGSDLKEGPIVERLRAEGIAVAIGHHPCNVGDAELVAISSAIPETNSELSLATRQGLTVLRRSDLLPAIAEFKRTIAVAGTHGKTTTASMLSMLLSEAGLAPSFVIGGDINEVGSGAAWDAGDWLVLEADESDRTFLALSAEIGIITSIEADHLETYAGETTNLFDAFATFANASEKIIMSADDPRSAELARQLDAVTYGTEASADYQLVEIARGRSEITFILTNQGKHLVTINLPIAGLHNARNATAAVVSALQLGVSAKTASQALEKFGGVARRYEFRGQASGICFVDDYAHLPTEITAALAAAKDGGWDRIVAVFQPHRFSRTADLSAEFANAFVDADEVVVTDIYSAGETPRPGVSGKLVVDAVLAANPTTKINYLPHLGDLADHLLQQLREGDLCLTLGAGDLTAVPDAVLEKLRDCATT